MNYEELIRELRELDRANLAEIFYQAFSSMEERYLDTPSFVYRKVVLAEVSWEDEGVPIDINIICPSPSFTPNDSRISEVGKCDRCGANLCSAFKEVHCPVCKTLNGLT